MGSVITKAILRRKNRIFWLGLKWFRILYTIWFHANADELSNYKSASGCIEHLTQYRLFRKGLVPLNLVTYLCQMKITRSLVVSDTVCARLGNLFSYVSFAKSNQNQLSVSLAFQKISSHYWRCKIRRREDQVGRGKAQRFSRRTCTRGPAEASSWGFVIGKVVLPVSFYQCTLCVYPFVIETVQYF
jgi:hypothetical protein